MISQLFNVFLFLAGMGGMFFRMARDNDDLVRAVLVLVAGSGCTVFVARARLAVPPGIALPCIGFSLAMFLSSLLTINVPESMVEFLKIGVYQIVFLTLAARARHSFPRGISAQAVVAAIAMALGGIATGYIHTTDTSGKFMLWSNPQVAFSIISTGLFCGAFIVLLGRGTIRTAVMRGLWLMALTGCVLGFLQFYGIDPLRPWDPRSRFFFSLPFLPADVSMFLASIVPGRLDLEGGGVILQLPRLLGIYGNPDFFAPYLLQFIPIAVATAILNPSRRIMGIFMTVFLFLILGLTAVWGAFFSLIVLAPFFIAMTGFAGGRFTESRAMRIAAVFLAAGVALLVILTLVLHASGRKSNAIEERLVKYRMAVAMWQRAPLTGVGLNCYKSWYPAIQQKIRIIHALPFGALGSSFSQENRTHNDILQMIAETGVVGSGLFLWFMTSLLLGSLRYLRKWKTIPPADRANVCGLAGSVLVVLIYAPTNFPFHIVSSAATFWVLAGLLASYQVTGDPPRETAPLPPAGRNTAASPKPPSEAAPFLRPAMQKTLTAASALTALLMTAFCVRLFMGTLEYKRAERYSQGLRPSDPRKAAGQYDKAIRLDPFNAQYAYDFGAMCFNSLGQDAGLAQLADTMLRRSFSLGFVNEDLAFGLGHIAESKARLEKAPRTLEWIPVSEADMFRPDRITARAKSRQYEALTWFTLGTSIRERHDPSRGRRRAILMAELVEADKAYNKRRFALARDLYAGAAGKNPGNYLAIHRLGTISVTPFGDLEAGITDLREAARVSVNEPGLYFDLARVLVASCQPGATRAASKAPSRDHAALILDRYKEARRALEISAALDPENAETAAFLDSLSREPGSPAAGAPENRAAPSGEKPAGYQSVLPQPPRKAGGEAVIYRTVVANASMATVDILTVVDTVSPVIRK